MTAITSEIERFNRLSATWWNSEGPMRPLHVVNALRLDYVVEQIAGHFTRDKKNALTGLRILDVGCGGGLMSEPLARLGAQVVGVDASPGNISAARLHAAQQGVVVDYRLGDPTDVLSADEQFDVVLALEVVEHVSDVPAFVDTVARGVAPGGLLFASTIDRTWKSFVFAIVGAEYVLRVLPRGTHQWARFVRPTELAAAVGRSGLQQRDLRGMRYLPVLHKASWCRDTRVNYIASYVHSVQPESPRNPRLA
jgi:2-polyprenyl-6-hydroxyphenyl methylase/3-demethylubiquinone-9 3-methyltransferase